MADITKGDLMSNNKYAPSSEKLRLLEEYKKYIAESLVRDYHIGGIVDLTNLWQNWVTELKYSEKLENFVVERSKIFLRIMKCSDANSKNPYFLKSLVNSMADFVSMYSCQSGLVPRNQAKDALIYRLWNENEQIQGLLCHNSVKKNKSSKQRRKANQRDKKYKQQQHAEDAAKIATEVKNLFFNAKMLPTKKR